MNLEARDLDGFFGEIVTSSPIERKRFDNEAATEPSTKDEYNTTWSALLGNYRAAAARPKNNKQLKSQEETHEETSSSYEPLAQTTVKVLLTPGRNMHVLSSSTRKFSRQATPGRPCSYSKLSKAYSERCKGLDSEEEEDEESIQTIKAQLKAKDAALTLEQINRYERIVQRHVARRMASENHQGATATAASAGTCQDDNRLPADSELLRFVEDQVGKLNLTPSSKRVLKIHEQQQEKRLIGLSIAKRKSAVEIKKKIHHQQVAAKQQIKSREEQELKQIKASKLRQKAMMSSTLFSQARSAHHQRVVKEVRLKSNVDQLQRQLQSEKAKNSLQANKIVHDVWSAFLRDQYDELRQEVRQRQQEQKEVVRGSEAQLQRFKSNYEDKLKELKSVAAVKAKEAGLEKKEVAREIDRIRRNMERQFQTEFASLLQRIETKGEHNRLVRAEKASEVQHKLQKADYTFDM